MRVQSRTADLEATNLKLRKVIEERKRLENELLEIAENERRRIGFDLHDEHRLMFFSTPLGPLPAWGVNHRPAGGKSEAKSSVRLCKVFESVS